MNTQTAVAAPVAQETKPELIINGVNVSNLFETINAIENDPAIANFQFRARNTWVDGGLNEFTFKDFYGALHEHTSREVPFAFKADEPEVLLGEDRGPNPVEYLLGALSACMTTTLAYKLAARGIEVDSISSDYQGDLDLHGFLDLDSTVRSGFNGIRVNFKVKSDADMRTIEELIRTSPVYDMIANPVPIKINVECK